MMDHVTYELPERVGGRLALDFVNTVDPRHAADRRDYLSTYDALLVWADDAVPELPMGISTLRRMSAADPSAAAEALSHAIALREALYRLLTATAAGRRVEAADLEIVNASIREATDRVVLQRAPGGGVRDAWEREPSLSSPLWPVALDAWTILTEGSLDRLHECPGDGDCGWLFWDSSRSGTRRWCDMRTCGNRAKARNHYAKARSS
jgi:predicted RNA-binding Zn ribbon-like protein